MAQLPAPRHQEGEHLRQRGGLDHQTPQATWKQVVSDCKAIARRTDNEIKNYWNTTLVKKLQGELPQFNNPYRTISTGTESNSSCTATKPPPQGKVTVASLPTDADSNMARAFCGLDAPLMLPLLAVPEGYSGSAMGMLAVAWPLDSGAWEEPNIVGIEIEEFGYESQRGDGIKNCQDLEDMMASEGATNGTWEENDDPPSFSLLS
ncbi:hypothetical protein ZIOFF_025776 [Zingiber officinale]|uniref:Uncharacterized protein n=1 Tax=Zingiber officinale TaxID=94328 RepID=A0A8J5HCC1_ZINOF|nr:hypothetical protein ZIOFF_025776 [Zingiber officinale]